MTLKRFLKGPLIWIVGIFVFFIIGSQLVASTNAPTRVDTWEAISAIETGKVQEALVRDRDQMLILTLTDGTVIESDYLVDQGLGIIASLAEARANGNLPGGYNVEVPRDNLFFTLLINILPFLLLIFLIFFFMGQMGGGVRGVRQCRDHWERLFRGDQTRTHGFHRNR